MKTYKLLIISLAMLLAGCGSDFLNLQDLSNPNSENFYRTAADAEKAIIAAYAPIGHNGCFGEIMVNYINALDDYMTHEQARWKLFSYTAKDGEFSQTYRDLFVGVYRCNLVIQKIPSISKTELSDKDKNQILGQAYFMRGLYYFYLATLYNQPQMVLENKEDPELVVSNSHRDTVYSQVVKDLDSAIVKLPISWPSKDLGRATWGAAMALKGKTLLYMARFPEAKATLAEVINSNIYKIVTPKGTDSLDYVYAYLCNFAGVDLTNGAKVYKSEFNTESVFEIPFTETNPVNRWIVNWQCSGHKWQYYNSFFGYSNMVINRSYSDFLKNSTNYKKSAMSADALKNNFIVDPRFYAQVYDDGDKIITYQNGDIKERAKRFSKTSDENDALEGKAENYNFGLKKYYFPYYINQYTLDGMACPTNYRVIRYSDVLLMFAEASFRSDGANAEALNAINVVRQRAGMNIITTIDKKSIIDERSVEFAFEQMRWYDLLRWYRDGWISKDELTSFYPNFQFDRNEYFPIPQDEINATKNKLKQNPGY